MFHDCYFLVVIGNGYLSNMRHCTAVLTCYEAHMFRQSARHFIPTKRKYSSFPGLFTELKLYVGRIRMCHSVGMDFDQIWY